MKSKWWAAGGGWLAAMVMVGVFSLSQQAGAVPKRLLTIFGGTGTNTQFTAGSIVFAGATDGNYTQDNANFNYSSGLTLLTANKAAVNAVDSLTVGGVIVPQYFYFHYRQTAGETPTTATIWNAPEGCKLVGVLERHLVAGTNGSAVTINVYKDPSGTAPGAGTAQLTAALSLKATINTNQSGALSATPSDLTFAAGDGLSVVLTGTMTAVAGVSVTFKFQRL
jgi:hypothetical protein